jgi:hypothetical protein
MALTTGMTGHLAHDVFAAEWLEMAPIRRWAFVVITGLMGRLRSADITLEREP